jgi:hypothetical protein
MSNYVLKNSAMDEETVTKPEVEYLEIYDKYDHGWPPEFIYSDWDVRITLTRTVKFLESFSREKKIKKILDKRLGVRDKDWVMFVNVPPNFDDIVYIKNTASVVTWMLADDGEMKRYIESIYVFKGNR